MCDSPSRPYTCSQDHSIINCHNLQSYALVMTTSKFLNASQFCSFRCCITIIAVFFHKQMLYISSLFLNINYKKKLYHINVTSNICTKLDIHFSSFINICYKKLPICLNFLNWQDTPKGIL
jgi:hypothetical protein